MAQVADDSPHLNKVALVAAWLHDPPMAEGIYGGTEVVKGLLSASVGAAVSADEPTILVGGSITD
jgi:hypothetical protein